MFQFDVSEDQFQTSDNDMIGWTVNREDGVISATFTEDQIVYFRNLADGIPLVNRSYAFRIAPGLPAIFSIAARVTPGKMFYTKVL